MSIKGIKYQFSASPWQYEGPGGWHFVSFPDHLSAEIRTHFKTEKKGWGRLPVLAKIGNSEWKTALWYSKQGKGYLLPLKAKIREQEKLELGKAVGVSLWI